MPCKGVTIDVEPCLSCSIYVVLHCCEIHFTIAIHTTSHFHSIACHCLSKVLVGQVLNCGIVKIVIDCSTNTKLEIGIL